MNDMTQSQLSFRPAKAEKGAVDWSSYAAVYDLLLEHNPAYQDILNKFENELKTWHLGSNASIVEVGAGTGNFSIAAAAAYPEAQIFHLDADVWMNEHASRKAADKGLKNFIVLTANIDSISLKDLKNADAVIAVHSLYAFQNPQRALLELYALLKPGGIAFFCDLGRVLNIGDWARYIAKYLIKKVGVIHAVKIFIRGRQIFKQNRVIRAKQQQGHYWTHTHKQFCAAVEDAGFIVLSEELAYRGYSDLVVAQKI